MEIKEKTEKIHEVIREKVSKAWEEKLDQITERIINETLDHLENELQWTLQDKLKKELITSDLVNKVKKKALMRIPDLAETLAEKLIEYWIQKINKLDYFYLKRILEEF